MGSGVKLTKAQKRVAIAKDVIKQVKLSKYEPASMCYVEFLGGTVPANFLDDQPATEVVTNTIRCRTCALGSAFLSAVDKFNKVSVVDAFGPKIGTTERGLAAGDDITTIHRYLRRFFSKRQLGEIECHFEGWGPDDNFGCPAGVKQFTSDSAFQFRRKNPNHSERLLKIMRNIVRNGGTFVPPGSRSRTR